MRPRVVVTRRLPGPVEERIAGLFDASLNPADRPFSREDLSGAICSADGLLPTVTDRLDAGVLGAGRCRVRIIANFGAGYDNVDVAAAREAGVVVTNTPDILTNETADLAMTLILMAARRAGEGERYVRAGRWIGWGPTQMLGTRVSGKTLGIVCMGRIGRSLARRAHLGFGMRILYYARRPLDVGVPAERRGLDDLLAESDVVSLHCPSTPETRHLIDAARLSRMCPHAVLVNTARGDIVDEAALAEALRSGTIAAAGLDVYEREPSVTPALLALENVVLLPHMGSATTETRVAMGMRAVDNLEAFFSGHPPRDRVG